VFLLLLKLDMMWSIRNLEFCFTIRPSNPLGSYHVGAISKMET
jgi:hypothetical protein